MARPKGIKPTEEWKKAQSERLKSQYALGKRTCYFKGKIPWNKGRIYNLDQRRAISESTKRGMNKPEIKEKLSKLGKERIHKSGYSMIHSGSFKAMQKHWNWKGGKIIRKGYIWIKAEEHSLANKKGYYPEHRIIVERFIQRVLKPEEMVHHIDRNKQNNDIHNLMLFENIGEHNRFHNRVRRFGFTNPILFEIKNRWNKYGKEIKSEAGLKI